VVGGQFRRLHDTDRSAWWLWLLLFSGAGLADDADLWSQHGTPEENRFGPDPKAFP
jgi:uncharacterized membrane protein YhaH (DUF805 family)